MIFERPIGSLTDAAYNGKTVDWLEVEWFENAKRIDRKHTVSGREIGLRLDSETCRRGLRTGDVLYADENTAIVVCIVPCSVLHIAPATPGQTVKACYELGNHHAPFFYSETEGEFLTPYDAPLYRLLETLGISVRQGEAVLDPSRAISSTTGHTHHHHHHGE